MTDDEVIKEIDNFDIGQREKVLKHLQKYFNDAIMVGSNYDWWLNENDDQDDTL